MVDHFYYPLTNSITYQPVMFVEGFITPEDLAKITEQLKTVRINAALIGLEEPKDEESFLRMQKETHALRKSNISFLHGEEWNWLYEKLSGAVNYANVNNYSKVLYGISPLQYSEYDSKYNGFYGPHTDNVNNIKTGLQRSLSFSLQLTDGDTYEGGDVKIYYNDVMCIANRTAGVLTFFDSNTFHEVTPVTSGFRKSLVGWVLGPRV